MIKRAWILGSIVLLALVVAIPFAVSAQSSSAEKLTVTVPNGGEAWEVGTSNSITWKPYGYDPDINPSGDVEAYLERKLGFFYLPVGKIMPSGKASIHWEGEIDSYGNYPKPGKGYSIRIKNTKTGETDRSDKTFTLTPRTVDLKVNRSNGPVKLSDGQQVTLSWTTTGEFKDCIAHGVRSTPTDESYQIHNLPTKGSTKGYYRADYGPIYLSCEKEDGSNRSDFVAVKSSATTQGNASVTVTQPNGGERLRTDQPVFITYTGENLRSASIALYKNDQFFKWIAKDITPERDGAKGTGYSYGWNGVEESFAQAGEVFKIYITASPARGKGYVDDKSDAPFRFVSQSLPVPAPSCVLTFSPDPRRTTFVRGDEITIQWTSANADYVILPEGDKGDANGKETYELATTRKFTYTFVGAGGETVCGQTIEVDDAGQDSISIVDFTATPNTIFSKRSVTLAWTTENADSCELYQSKVSGSTSVAVNGSKSVTIADTTTFKLKCKNSDLSVEDSVTVMKAEYNTTPTTETDSSGTGGTKTDTNIETETRCVKWYCQLEAAVGTAVSGLKSLFSW